MNRNYRLLTMLIFTMIALVPMRPGNGDDRITRHCQKQIEIAIHRSPGHIVETLKLTSVLRRKNLAEALVNAEAAKALAEETSDSDFGEIAKAQVELIWRMQDSRATRYAKYTEIDCETLNPELRYQYRLAQLEAELFSGKSSANFERLQLGLNTAAKKITDPFLLIQADSLDLHVKVYRLGVSATSSEIIEQRDRVLQESRRLRYKSGIITAMLVESTGLECQKQQESQLAVLERALEVAEGSDDKFLTIQCYESLAFAYKSKREWGAAGKHFRDALGVAKSLGSHSLVLKVLIELKLTELQSGRPKMAAAYNQQIEECKAYQNVSPLTKNTLNRMAVSVYSQLGDLKQVEKYKRLLFPPAAVGLIQAQNREAKAKDAEIVREKKQAIVEKKNFRESTKRQQQRAAVTRKDLSFFQNYSLVATVIVFLLVPWFVLLLMRSRLKHVSKALNTERETSHRNEIHYNELTVRLNRLQRMESLGLMAGSVAHDFNNLLVGVLGNAEVIQLKQNSDSAAQPDSFVNQRIECIIKSAEKAAGLSRQMLAYAGKQQIAKRSTDLNELIRQYESILRSACRENQRLSLQLFAEPVVSKVDMTQVEQAVLNLITNAVQASPDGSQITISTGRQTIENIEDSALYGTRSTGGDFCFIEVADHGCGISQVDRERVFEPFFSNSEQGRGLGLSVVYGVVVGHDGFVNCKSEVGHGTSFRILLPVSTEPAVTPVDHDDDLRPQSEFQIAEQPLRSEKILIIDDEATVLDLCSQLIQLNGWDSVTASCGLDGLRIATEHADELSCILVDVVMPEMGANELLSELDKRGINLPVVVMSGFSHTRLEFFLNRPNVVAIVEKPFRLSQITHALQNAMDIGHANQLVTVAQLATSEPAESPK